MLLAPVASEVLFSWGGLSACGAPASIFVTSLSQTRPVRTLVRFLRQRMVGPIVSVLLLVTNLVLYRLIDAHEASQTPVDEVALLFGMLVSLGAGVAIVRMQSLIRRRDEYVASLHSAQRDLSRSERRFRNFFERAAFGITIVSPEGKVLQANAAMAKLLGYSQEELQELSVVELSHPDEREDTQQELRRSLDGDQAPLNCDRRLIGKDGRPRWVHLGICWVLDEGGLPDYAIAIAKDIRERKKNEERLELADEILQRIHALVVVADGNGAITYVSPYVETVFGHPAEELLGDGWWQLTQVDDGARRNTSAIRDYVARCARREMEPIKEAYETQLLDAKGRAHSILWTDACGPDNVLLGVGHDVTDLTAAREEVLRLAEIVESTDEAIVSLDLNGTVLTWNAGATKLYGYPAREMIGKSASLLVPAERRDELSAVLEKAGKGLSLDPFETSRVNKDGQLVPVALTVSPIRDRSGKAIGCSEISRDLTESKEAQKLEEQFRQAQRIEGLGKLAGGIAHDFNNLIMIIRSYGELLTDQLSAEPQSANGLKQIMKAADRAASLTQQLLAFSRKQVLAPKNVDLNSIVEETARMLERMIGEDIDLKFVPSRPLSRVRVDPGQMSQVLINLSVNARDAMPTGGRLTIETQNLILDGKYADRHSPLTPGAYVALIVTDTGTGMSKEVQERVFEPFFTTKEQGKGTGLGLSTVYGIVKQSGGFIWVYSEPGQGTSIKILLPCVDQQVAAQESRPHQEVERGSETILLVEDEPALRESLASFLSRTGYKVLEAANGEEALSVAKKHSGIIDIVLSDVVMPKVSGRDFVTALLAIKPDVKVLFMSGYTDDTIVRHGVLNASVAFLQKPFALGALSRKLREVLAAEPVLM